MSAEQGTSGDTSFHIKFRPEKVDFKEFLKVRKRFFPRSLPARIALTYYNISFVLANLLLVNFIVDLLSYSTTLRDGEPNNIPPLVHMVIALAGFFGIYTLFQWAIQYRYWEVDNFDHEVLAGKESIELQMGGAKAQFAWGALNAVQESSAYLFFVHNANGGIVVPKRAFASPAEAEAFSVFAQERFAASRAQA